MYSGLGAVIDSSAQCDQLAEPHRTDCHAEFTAGGSAYVYVPGLLRKTPIPWWVWIALGVGGLAAVGTFAYGMTRKKPKKRRRKSRR